MLNKERAVEQATALMMSFAERTGLTSERPTRRYLWTDAFAVCNFLALARATGDARHTEIALRLVGQVHHLLGRHRTDDARSGWISGLGEQEGEAHPTRGGLRIGKPLAERGRDESFDERLEWERDGQYFHYLTKWMHALDQVARFTREPRFNVWARELADAAHAAFTSGPPGRRSRRMVWKMSTDLSRVLVPSMGHHDPLDGFVTCVELQTTAAILSATSGAPTLNQAVTDFAAMIEDGYWATVDPLGIGGLLMDVCRIDQLMRHGAIAGSDLRDSLLAAALDGLSRYLRQRELRQPATLRLAFRELGLAIGLSAVVLIESGARSALAPYVAVGADVTSFWLDPTHRRTSSWLEHEDINEVMLATSLVPDGVLVILPAE